MMQDIREKLEFTIEVTQERGYDWFPLSIEDAKTLLQALNMFCWGVKNGDTIIVSQKEVFTIAMIMRKGKTPIADIEGKYPRNPVVLARAIEAILTDMAAGVEALIDAMER